MLTHFCFRNTGAIPIYTSLYIILWGSQDGLTERSSIPSDQPQSIPSFSNANSSVQQLAVPSLASSKDQLPPSHDPKVLRGL